MPGFATYTQSNAVFKANFNFGQRPFKHPQSGYKALCSTNLPDVFAGEDAGTINNPSKFFDVKTYTGTGATDRDVKGLGFQPDLVWIKNRSDDGQNPTVHDAARGVARPMYTDSSPGETLQTSTIELKAFNSDGFRLGTNARTNALDKLYTSWSWDAGTAGTANTAGTIDVDSPNQWVNTTAGFSITKYEGNNTASQNIGHGLNNKPEFMILKKSETTGDWHVGFDVLTWEKHLYLGGSTGGTDAEQDDANVFSDTAPTGTLWYTGANGSVNGNDHDHICYAWTPIRGFSAFGKWNGTENADGPYIYTGFRPRWFLTKPASVGGAGKNWLIFDSKMKTYNPTSTAIIVNTDDAEVTGVDFDFLSNGVKVRTAGANTNPNGATMVWAAFAEHPFKIARAK